MQGGLARLDSNKPGNNPDRKILRGEATTRSGDIPSGEERLVEHRDSCFLDPGLGSQVGTGRNTIKKTQLREDEGAGALSAQKLPSRIKPKLTHDRGVLDDVPGQ